MLILGSKTLCEKMGNDVMSSLEGKAQVGDRSSGVCLKILSPVVRCRCGM